MTYYWNVRVYPDRGVFIFEIEGWGKSQRATYEGAFNAMVYRLRELASQDK